MGALNFKEIPEAHSGPERDQFELFARELLLLEGFRIIEHPDRGADGGRDLIVEEDRMGPGGANVIRWLVSCKHKAHSGRSVGPADEFNIRDRLGTHRCNGFITFYSTLPSSGVAGTCSKLRPEFEYLQFDCEVIERKLLADNPRARVLAARYMPKSFNKWLQASQIASLPVAPKDPHHTTSRYFLRAPHDDLGAAKSEAEVRGLLVFVVVYDPDHPTHSKIDHSLGYFMEYQYVKRLVDQNFVPVVGPSSDEQLAQLVPEDDPLENCLWVVMTAEGEILRREGVYANSDEGLKRVRQVIARRNKENG